MGKPILCVDFDGVIHSYTSGWQGADVIPDPPVPGALEFLAEATKHFDVCIFSSRTHQPGGPEAMQNWLWKAVTGEDYHDGTIAVPVWVLKIRWPDYKPAAFLSIDDRAIRFLGTFPDPESLLGFVPWHKSTKLRSIWLEIITCVDCPYSRSNVAMHNDPFTCSPELRGFYCISAEGPKEIMELDKARTEVHKDCPYHKELV